MEAWKIIFAAAVLFIGAGVALNYAQASAPKKYFDDSSPVMYFWSEDCHFCKLQVPVLNELAEEGFRVKSMDVGKNPGYWQDYAVGGTPTFLASDGERLIGLQPKEKLRAWLEKKGAKTA